MRNSADVGGAPDQAGQCGRSRCVAAPRAAGERADPAPCLVRHPARRNFTSGLSSGWRNRAARDAAEQRVVRPSPADSTARRAGPRRTTRAAVPPARRRRASSAVAPCGRTSGSAPPSLPAGTPARARRRPTREMDSFISVPPRSLTPARSAAATPSRTELHPRHLDVRDPRVQRETRHRVHEQRLAERRARTRLAAQPHRRLHVHERERHELR